MKNAAYLWRRCRNILVTTLLTLLVVSPALSPGQVAAEVLMLSDAQDYALQVPAAPSNLTAVKVDDSSVPEGVRVDLHWTDNANDEIGFQIETDTNQDYNNPMTIALDGDNLTTYRDKTVYLGGTFWYRVRSKDAAGSYSTWSNSASVSIAMPSAVPPAAPSNLTATAVSVTQVDLVWVDNSNNETTFQVERATDNLFSVGQISFMTAINITAYSDTSVVAGATYHYRVSATNALGSSMPSNVASATPVAPAVPTAPSAPSGVSATAVSATEINVSWTDNSANETSFHVHRATNTGFTTGLTGFSGIAANVTEFSDNNGLAPGTTYYYRVYSVNAVGSSVASGAVSVATPAAGAVPPPATGSVPAAPTGLTATVMSNNRADLLWVDNASNETGFYVDTALDQNFSASLMRFSVGPNVTNYSDVSVYPGATFYYRVIAYNTVGGSAYSNVSVAAITGTTPTPAPIPAATPTPAPVPTPAVVPVPTPTVRAIPTPTSVPSPAPAVAPAPVPTPASTSSAPPAIPDAEAPSDLTAEASMKSVDLKWHDNSSGERGFYVEQSLGGRSWTRIAETEKNGTTFRDKGMTRQQSLWANVWAFFFGGLDRNTTYYYRVQAFNASGESRYSNVVSVTTTK